MGELAPHGDRRFPEQRGTTLDDSPCKRHTYSMAFHGPRYRIQTLGADLEKAVCVFTPSRGHLRPP